MRSPDKNATATGTSSTGTRASRSAIWSIFAFRPDVPATPAEVETISLSSTDPILPDAADIGTRSAVASRDVVSASWTGR